MPNVLIGQELGETLYQINAQLRAATLAEYNATAVEQAQYYSPWLCMFPLLTEREFPSGLIRQPTCEKGGLVTDASYLLEARVFMEPRIEMTRNGIFDQKHEDWIPITHVTDHQLQVFNQGRSLLLESHATLARMYLELVDFVLPLGGQRNRGYASPLTRGIVYRTLPNDGDRNDVAIDLAHEMGHYALITLQSVDPIISSDRLKPIYSQIRRTLRPAIQTFHASVALAFMHLLVQSRPEDREMQAAGQRRGLKYTDSIRKSLLLSLDSLDRDCEFTAVGRRVMWEMREVAA
jgi:hypothetical protein